MDVLALTGVVNLIGSNLQDDLQAIGDTDDVEVIRQRVAHANDQLRALLKVAADAVDEANSERSENGSLT